MARPRFRGLLLCEDKEHERFFKRLLEKWFGRGKLRVNRIPNNAGAGDAYVIANYVREVQFARSRRYENVALIVVVDGDRIKIQERLRQLDQRLVAASLQRRSNDERIVVFVPTRNIETWELWLCGHRDLDEESDFKSQFRKTKQGGGASVKEAVDGWFRQLTAGEVEIEEKTLPSLASGRMEIQRLDGLPRN